MRRRANGGGREIVDREAMDAVQRQTHSCEWCITRSGQMDDNVLCVQNRRALSTIVTMYTFGDILHSLQELHLQLCTLAYRQRVSASKR